MDTIIYILRIAFILFVVTPLSLVAARYALRLVKADITRQYMRARRKQDGRYFI